jgi:TfoX/Sxy family transcriptional regulator of competence genes
MRCGERRVQARDGIGLPGPQRRPGRVRSCTPMAYDEDLANRLRELLADEDAITEKKMFGGLAFLQHGNMTVSASRNGGLLARIDPADTETALARPHVELMRMGGRTMDGWITVAPEGLRTKRELAAWVKRSLAFVRTLPAK